MISLDSLLPEIRHNLQSVRERMEAAAERAGRAVSEVELVAISKSQPVEKIIAAYECGQRVFGENRVLEGIEKEAQLDNYKDIHWHMVGHIQSRKAEEAALHFDVIHSVDRLKIARRLDQFHAQLETRLPVYLEFNVSGEASKGGWDFSQRKNWNAMLNQVRPVFELEHLEVIGLMTMAPWIKDVEVLRKTFSTLRDVSRFMQGSLNRKLPGLSMGMTDDFEIAIEEGATAIRVGRAIFGERQ